MELIAYCRDSKIPTIITSAGITNVIAAVFEEHGISTAHDDHFYIDANHMEFHLDDGTLQKILPHVPVHSYSKKHVHRRAPHMFTTINHNHRKRSPDQFAESCMSSSIISSQIAEDIVVTESPFKENSRQIVTDCVAEVAPQNNRGSNGVAAIILGDNVGDFEVLRELSDINEASLFRLGYAVNKEKADRLMSLDCCDVILIGDKHNAEVVLMLLKKLVESRDKKAEIKTK